MNEAALLAITSYALNAAWQAGAITMAAWALEKWMGQSSPGARHGLWLGACALSLLIPLATTDFSSLSRLPAEAGASIAASAQPAGDAWTVERARWQLPVAVVLQWLVLALIAGGAIFAAARLARGSLGLLALRRRATSRVSPPLCSLALQCADGLGLKRPLEVLAVEGLAGPVTYGVTRAVVLIPTELSQCDDDDLMLAVFGHELAHARRNDFLLHLLCEAALLPLAWHPAASRIRERLAQTREEACDDLVTSMLADRKRYARSLLRIATASLNAAPGLGMSDGGALEQRIRNLMSRPARPQWLKLAGSAVSMLLTGTLASFAMVQAVAPQFKVEPKHLAGTWEGDHKGYHYRIAFTGQGEAVFGRVDVGRGPRASLSPAKFVIAKVGDPPKLTLPPPPPPPPPPPGVLADTGEFGKATLSRNTVRFRVRQTSYQMRFDPAGNARLRAQPDDGKRPEFDMTLVKAQPTN